jgi:hypothetical protein
MKLGYLTLILFLGVAAGASPAAPSQATIPQNETLTNGDFARPLASGWATQANDILGGHNITATPENGAVVRKEMCGNATLIQDVKLSTTLLNFSTRARLFSQVTKPDYYATASVLLGYLDVDGKKLGETRIYNAAGTPPWKASNTLHLVPVADTGKWHDYNLNLWQELCANLKGVDPTKVKRLRVSLESFCSGKDAC